MIPRSLGYLGLLAVLAALPVVALAWAARTDPRPIAPGRGLLSFALALAGLVWLDSLRGLPAVLGGAALFYGFLSGAGGMRRYHKVRFGATFARERPELAARDALRLHLFLMIVAVACLTAGIIFVTLPRAT